MRRHLRRFEAAAALVVIAGALFTGLSAVKFHPDESHWIGLSAPFEAFFSGRLLDPIWRTRQDRYMNAPITYYVVGAARRIGGYTPEQLNLPYRFDGSRAENLSEGRVPEAGLLTWGRRGVTASAVMAIFVSFVLFARAASRPAAYLWLGLVLIHPYLRVTLRRAMNEGVLLAALALVLWAAYRLLVELDRPESGWHRWRLAGWAALAGSAAGLAAQTKLNGAMAGLGVLVILVMAAIRSQMPARRRAACLLLGAVILAGCQSLVFLGTNPTLWPYPPREVVRVLRTRAMTTKVQVLRAGDAALRGVSDRARVIPKRVFHDYALLPKTWAGVSLTFVGAVLAIGQLRRWLVRSNDNHALVALAVIGAAVSAPILFTPLDWGRFYLLPVYFFGFPTVMGADWLGRRLWAALNAARARR